MAQQTMAAIQVHGYGGADRLTLDQTPRPEPGDGEALVRGRAAGVNPIDWKLRDGGMKDFMPMRFPYVPGVELAGVVERIGSGVTTVQPGQEVFGRAAHGSYAEYALAPARDLAPKPATVGFDEAAAIPLGATTAWQGLFDHGHLARGQRALILGGAGGVVAFAVQRARWTGAEVIATASARNADYVRALGARTVIDYATTRVEDVARDVDLESRRLAHEGALAAGGHATRAVARQALALAYQDVYVVAGVVAVAAVVLPLLLRPARPAAAGVAPAVAPTGLAAPPAVAASPAG